MNNWQLSAFSRFIKTSCGLFLFLILFLTGPQTSAQEADSSKTATKRLKQLAIGGAAAYTAGWIGLDALWYSGKPRTAFHFFNDNQQWMLVDKAGHSFTTYHLSRSSAEALKWAGMSSGKAVIYGSVCGFLMMLPIEIMDGYARDYGASLGDLGANTLGALLYGSQQLLWKESRIKPKFSFHFTPFSSIRPNTLGDNLPSRILKDYNGQTYWLSVDLYKFLPKDNKFPHWLNVAIGYGAENMVYGQPEANHLAGYEHYSQFFIAPDINFSEIKTNKKWVKALLFVLESIHLPSPALELNKNRMRLHPVYF